MKKKLHGADSVVRSGRWWRALRRYALIVACGLHGAAMAADDTLTRAAALVADHQYAEAHALLAPLATAPSTSGTFAYLYGRAALGNRQPEEARAWLSRSLELRPDSVEAYLALGQAYTQLGMFAEARLAFENVFRFDNLPPDLESQVRIYSRAATRYLEQDERLLGYGYAMIGIGQYRVNSTRGTRATGEDERRDTFYNARVGGALNYELADNYVLDASLDYRFRYYDNPETRNDSDLRWQVGGSRTMGEGNLALGFQGRVSYRGESTYRNDYGLFADYRYRLDPYNQIAVGGEVYRRRYPQGAQRENIYSSALANLEWVHALAGGQASLSLKGHAGYNFATGRPDGDAMIYGLEGTVDFKLTSQLSGFIFATWEHNAFAAENYHFHPDAYDESVALRRRDNLYEVGGGLVWSLGQGWSLRPELLFIRDQSNALAENYSSTEAWLNLRRDF